MLPGVCSFGHPRVHGRRWWRLGAGSIVRALDHGAPVTSLLQSDSRSDRTPQPPSAPGMSRPARLLHLQRTAGNRAAQAIVQRDQDGCPLGEAQQRDPNSLTGTRFDAFDPQLKDKLATSNAKGSHPTLAEALCAKSNAEIAVLARVGSMISRSAPFLWTFVEGFDNAWITDNFGIRCRWTSASGLAAALGASAGWCQDFWASALAYHGTTQCYRQIPGSPGAASLHVAVEGSHDIHIDVHQPVEGKEPWGTCNYNVSAWASHASDVQGGGARSTPIGRYSAARDRLNRLPSTPTGTQESRIAQARRLLDAIQWKVQRYAAMGELAQDVAGADWAGDAEMRRDRETMTSLEQAEALIDEVIHEMAVAAQEEADRRWGRGPRW